LLLERDDEDSWLTFHDPGQFWYSMGIDRSNSGALSLNYGGVLNSSQFVMTKGGDIGIGTGAPKAVLDVASFINGEKLGTVFGRLHEGNNSGSGTSLGVKGYGTQFHQYDGKSFAIEHSFYGEVNSSINFFRGGSRTGGFITFNTATNEERMRINSNGNVGIGTGTPRAVLDVASFINGEKLGTVFGRLSEGNTTGNGTYLGVRGYGTQNSQFDGKSFAIEHSFYGEVNSSINFIRGGSRTGGFITFNTATNEERMRINSNGNVGIGTTNPGSHKLAVNGTIKAKEVKVTMEGWYDFVFAEDYVLPPLEEVEKHIKTHKHLPAIPSEAEVLENGIELGEMNSKLLQKIEELTLYTIEQHKELEEQRQENENLKQLVLQLAARIEKLEQE
jgi:hypothetical protein